MERDSIEQQQARIHINGIKNTTGCTCYIASTINLLYHCIPKLRDALITLLMKTLDDTDDEEKCNNLNGEEFQNKDMEFLLQLSRLFLSLTENHADNVVDATDFYMTLRDWNNLPLNLYEQGDAASMMSLIISRISNVVQLEMLKSHNNIIQCGLLESLQELEGTTVQTIIGDYIMPEKNKPTNPRKRVQNPRIFRGPFPITAVGYNSVLDGLAASTIVPQKVDRYKWTPINDEEDGVWITHRTVHFHKTPHHLIFHLKRFLYDANLESEDDTLVTKCLHYIDVPLTIDLAEFVNGSDESHQQRILYSLQGVISHAGKKSNDGHYLTLINGSAITNKQTTDMNQWFVLDDETVSELDVLQLSSFTKGGDSSRLYDDDEEMPLCAMVLLYTHAACETDGELLH
jgi:hypothetical protein